MLQAAKKNALKAIISILLCNFAVEFEILFKYIWYVIYSRVSE